MRRRLNVKFLVISLVGFASASVGVHQLHGYQVKRNASSLLRQADRAESGGDVVEANKFRERYLAYVPDDRDVLMKYSLTLASDEIAKTAKERAQALAVLEKALLRDPGRDDARRRAARLAMDLRQLPDAKGHLEILVKSTPDDGESELLLGRCQEADGKFAEAAALYESARKHRPDLIESYTRLAGLLRTRLGEEARADRVMDAVEVKDGLIAANGRSSRAYLERARYRKTYQVSTPGIAADLARALELDPDDADTLLESASREREAGRLDEARVLLDRGVAKHPRDARMYVASSELELRADRPEEAIARLQRGDEMLPGQPDILWARAELLIQLHHLEEARGAVARIAAIGYPPSLLDYLNGRIAFEKGEWAAAAAALESSHVALAGIPELAETARTAVFLLGRCYEQLGNPERQQSAFRRVIETTPKVGIDPSWIPAHFGLATAWAAMGKLDEAIDAYRRVAARSPEAKLAAAKLLVARELRLDPSRRHWPPIEQALDEAEAEAAGSVDVAIQRAEILVAQGRLEPARALLQAARDRKPDRPEAWSALAALAGRRGKPAEAETILDEGARKLGDLVDFRLVRANLRSARAGLDPSQALDGLEAGLDAFGEQDRRRLLAGLARARSLMGDARGAGRLWSRLADEDRTNLDCRLDLFELAYQAKDEAGMGRLLDEIRGIEGEDGCLWRYGRARALIRRAREQGGGQDLAEARSLLAAVAARRPNWANVPSAEAEIDEIEKTPEQAIASYRRAVKMGEKNPVALVRALRLLVERRLYGEADQVLAMLRALRPASPEIDRLDSEIALRSNDVARALDSARRLVKARPDGGPEHLWLAQVLQEATSRAEAQGQASESAARREEAIRATRRAIEIVPADPGARLTLVRLLAQAGRKDEARAATEQASRDLRWGASSILLANCYEAIGLADLAGECYQAALKASPDDPATLLAVVISQIRANRIAESLPGLRKIADLKDRSPREAAWANRTLAMFLAARGDRKESLKALGLLDGLDPDGTARSQAGASTEDLRAETIVMGLQPDRSLRRRAIRSIEDMVARQVATPDDRFRLAQLFAGEDEWPKARELMQVLLAADAGNPAYLAFYIDGLRRRGALDEAKVWLKRLERIRPDSPPTVEIKARLAHDQGRDDEATATLRTYASAHPERSAEVAVLLEELGRLDAAELMYRDCSKRVRQPEDILPLAGFLARRGRLSEALPIYERALRTCRTEVVSNSAVLSLHSASPDDRQCQIVSGWIEAAIAKDPSSRSLRFDLANLRCLQGRHGDAEEIFRRVFEDDPNDGTALNNMAWMLASSGRKVDEALAHIDRAIAIHGPQPALLDTRALVHIAMGHGALAVKDLDDALAGSSLPVMYYHLARARLLTGDRPGALEVFKKATASGLKAEALHPLEQLDYRKVVVDLARP